MSAHESNGIFQIPYLAGMKVGGGQFNITQGWGFECVFTQTIECDDDAALVLSRHDLGVRALFGPEPVIAASAKIDALVAFDAVLRDE